MSLELLERLDSIADSHRQHEGFTPRLIECRARLLQEFLSPGDVLDLGCADGLLTAYLCRQHRRVVAVDASRIRLNRTKQATQEFDNIELRQAFFEEFTPRDGELFDAVLLSCVLEHIPDPPGLLRRAAGFLKPHGRLVAIVPHGNSLHRRAGVLMGLLKAATDHGTADVDLEHERVYSLDLLRDHFAEAGLRLAELGGYLIKPLPNQQMADLPPDLVSAYYQLGREFPDISAEIFAIGER